MPKHHGSNFLAQLWDLLSKGEDMIKWAQDGKCIVIGDFEHVLRAAEKHGLKHWNEAYFKRQMVYYGFDMVAKRRRAGTSKQYRSRQEGWNRASRSTSLAIQRQATGAAAGR